MIGPKPLKEIIAELREALARQPHALDDDERGNGKPDPVVEALRRLLMDEAPRESKKADTPKTAGKRRRPKKITPASE